MPSECLKSSYIGKSETMQRIYPIASAVWRYSFNWSKVSLWYYYET
jgi:hypothetical protein